MDREGAKGINAALASQIMAQAGFPCARALNLQILLLKTRGKIFAKQKDFRETLKPSCGDDFGKEIQARQGARGLAAGSLLKRK